MFLALRASRPLQKPASTVCMTRPRANEMQWSRKLNQLVRTFFMTHLSETQHRFHYLCFHSRKFNIDSREMAGIPALLLFGCSGAIVKHLKGHVLVSVICATIELFFIRHRSIICSPLWISVGISYNLMSPDMFSLNSESIMKNLEVIEDYEGITSMLSDIQMIQNWWQHMNMICRI